MGDEWLVEVGRELRRLRTAAGLSGSGLARLVGVPQPTVSRVEMGRRVSDPVVVLRLFEVLGVGAAEAERLESLVQEAYAQTAPRRLDAGVLFRPGAGVELVRGARRVRVWESAVMPRLLRTDGYAAAAGLGAVAEWRSVLHEPGREVVVVLAEGVLRTWPGSGECMEEQFARVAEVAGLPHVRLGVVPDVQLRGVGLGHVALHGFTLVDEAAVTVETFTREIGLTDEREVRAYAEVFTQVERAAVFGESARGLVEQAAADVRRTLKAIH
ncbi:hypothetical protein GCM10009678_63160 [Actinomadura kijaniata]|nr:Scr1 family TA system antitoxin-like transcriptional regulator [Actinomadura namibiensis]